MRDLPNAFWAASFICMSVVVAVIVLFSNSPENVKQNVLTLCSSIVTGAFGYIQGKRDAEHSLQVPMSPNPGTTTSVTVNPTPPEAPAQTKEG